MSSKNSPSSFLTGDIKYLKASNPSCSSSLLWKELAFAEKSYAGLDFQTLAAFILKLSGLVQLWCSLLAASSLWVNDHMPD